MAVDKKKLRDDYILRSKKIKNTTNIKELEKLIDRELNRRYVPQEDIRIGINEELFSSKEFAELRKRYKEKGWSVMLGMSPYYGRCIIVT